MALAAQMVDPYPSIGRPHAQRQREILSLFGSLVDLNGPGRYVHWGFIQISVANLILIGVMVVVFVAAILIPLRRHRGNDQ
jgi:hypothetical protein